MPTAARLLDKAKASGEGETFPLGSGPRARVQVLPGLQAEAQVQAVPLARAWGPAGGLHEMLAQARNETPGVWLALAWESPKTPDAE